MAASNQHPPNELEFVCGVSPGARWFDSALKHNLEDGCDTPNTTQDSSKPAGVSCPPTRYRPDPVKDIAHLIAFPPAARARELKKYANTFAGTNGRNMFVHYVEPVLDDRRSEKIALGITKKKFYKNAAQLWALISSDPSRHGECFFWNHKAKELRQALSQGTISPEDLLRNAGFEEDWWESRRYAEMAAANYLEQEVPEQFVEGIQGFSSQLEESYDLKAAVSNEKKLPTDLSKLSFHDVQPEYIHLTDQLPLLDVLPERFEYDSKMMYGQFSHAEYQDIRNLEGKQQTARLRQLADLLDSTGKTLFYYYAYPHIWKEWRPLKLNETVAIRAQDKWKDFASSQKEMWRAQSMRTKKLLGDGNVDGLVYLELESLDPKVLDLHLAVVEALGPSVTI